MTHLQKIFYSFLASLCLIVGIGLLIIVGLPQREHYTGFTIEAIGYVAPEIGQHAPPFTLSDLSLNTKSLSDYQGKIVIINFWATWCIPCQIEMPELQDLYISHKSEIYVLGVNLGESPKSVAQWVDEFGLTYDILIDPLQSVAQTYQIRGQPTTYVLDKNSIIRHIYYGAVSMEQLEENINSLTSPH